MVSEYLGEIYPPYRWCERLDVIEQVFDMLSNPFHCVYPPSNPSLLSHLINHIRHNNNSVSNQLWLIFTISYWNVLVMIPEGMVCSMSMHPNVRMLVVVVHIHAIPIVPLLSWQEMENYALLWLPIGTLLLEKNWPWIMVRSLLQMWNGEQLFVCVVWVRAGDRFFIMLPKMICNKYWIRTGESHPFNITHPHSLQLFFFLYPPPHAQSLPIALIQLLNHSQSLSHPHSRFLSHPLILQWPPVEICCVVTGMCQSKQMLSDRDRPSYLESTWHAIGCFRSVIHAVAVADDTIIVYDDKCLWDTTLCRQDLSSHPIITSYHHNLSSYPIIIPYHQNTLSTYHHKSISLPINTH